MSKITHAGLFLLALALVPTHAAAASYDLDLSDPRDDVYVLSMDSRSGESPEYDLADGHPNIDLTRAWSGTSGDRLLLGLRVVGTIESRNHASGDTTSMSGTQYRYSFSVEQDGDDDPEFFVDYSDGKATLRYNTHSPKDMSTDASRTGVTARANGNTLLVEVPMTYLSASAPRVDIAVAAIEHQATYDKRDFQTTMYVDVLGAFVEFPELGTSSDSSEPSIFEAPAPTLTLAAAAAVALAAMLRRR